jgi:hypothetical protein
MIIPIIAAITAAKYHDIRNSFSFYGILCVSLIGFSGGIFLAVAYDISSTIAIDSDVINGNSIKELFYETSKSISIYLMLIIGLEVSPQAKNNPPKGG